MSAFDRTARRIGVEPKAVMGLAVIVAGMLLWVLAFTGGLAALFGSSTVAVKADFSSIEDIVPNDPVRIDGVQVGTVGASVPDANGRGATLTLNLDSEAPRIYRNASAQLVWRTALGADDAVRLDPGTRAAGALGDAKIPQSQTTSQVELDQITQAAFHGGAQQGLRTMLQQLAPAFRVSPETLNDDFDTLARIAPAATTGIGALRGEIPDRDLQNLVRQTGDAAQALSVGTNASDTRTFVQTAAHLLSDVAANPTALGASLQEADPALTLTVHAFTLINATAFKLDPLITELTPSAPRVAPTLRTLQPFVSNLRMLLRTATPLLTALRPTVHSLTDAADVGVPVITTLKPSLARLEKTILPGLDVRSPEEGGKPTYEFAGGTIVQLGVLSSFFDQNGNMANLTFGGNAFNDRSAGVLPCTVNFTGTDLLTCETLSEALGTFSTPPSSSLRSLENNPAAGALHSWITRALQAQDQFNSTKAKLEVLVPGLARWLFTSHGANR
jgi:ABC-type transporter Mla subunit MlaD